MKVYIISLLVVAVIGSIVTVLAPDGEGGGLKKHVRLAAGIAILPICIMPLISFAEAVKEFDSDGIFDEIDGGDMDEYESIFEDGYLLAESENLRVGIASLLKERFGIGHDECYVSVSISQNEDGKRQLERIFINLYGGAVWKDTGEIESYLSELFLCEVVTAVG